MSATVSVIIPIFNEEENIDQLVGQLNEHCQQEQRFRTEIIFVDDGSRDASFIRLKQANHSFYDCKIIKLSKNFGSHAALRAGIQESTGEYITFMYADLQDPLDLIPKMYDVILRGFNIVWAFRNSVQVSWSEKMFSKLYSNLMQRYAVANFPRSGFDIVMFTGKVRACLNENIENNSSIFIQILSLGFSQSNIHYDKQRRLFGKSKWTISKKIKLFIDSFVAFSFAPIRFVSIIGVCFFLAGIIWTAYIFFRKFLYDDLIAGWPALMSVLMVGFGITNISLGIIAEYLWRTLDASRKRPVFVIDEIIETNAK